MNSDLSTQNAILVSVEPSIDSSLRRWLPYYLLFVFASTVVSATNGYLARDGWMMGDWLTNYQGGMIRRGLLGELIFQLGTITSISIGLFVLVIHILLFAIFFLFSYLLLQQQKKLLPYALLIISPFIFTFQLYSSEGGFRKEIIFIALFAGFVYLANSVNERRFQKYFAYLLLLYPLVILTHEMLALLLPYLLVVYFSKLNLTKGRLFVVAALLIPSALSLLASLYYSGSQAQVDLIKASLQDKHFAIVGGALDWLAFSTSIAAGAVKGFIVDKSYLRDYGIVLLLAAIAYVPVRTRLVRLFGNKTLLALFVLILLGSLSLFAVAIDWGRFIYMHLVALFLLSLMQLPADPAEHRQPSPAPLLSKPWIAAIAVIAMLLYSQVWFIPHCCESWPLHSDFGSLNAAALFQPYTALRNFF